MVHSGGGGGGGGGSNSNSSSKSSNNSTWQPSPITISTHNQIQATKKTKIKLIYQDKTKLLHTLH